MRKGFCDNKRRDLKNYAVFFTILLEVTYSQKTQIISKTTDHDTIGHTMTVFLNEDLTTLPGSACVYLAACLSLLQWSFIDEAIVTKL